MLLTLSVGMTSQIITKKNTELEWNSIKWLQEFVSRTCGDCACYKRNMDSHVNIAP